MAPWIEFKNVHKKFKKNEVLKGVSFAVDQPGIVALLGVNGAGKTTSIGMMLGQVRATSGEVRLWGEDPAIPRVRQRVGLTPQNVEFVEGLKTEEILQFVASHYDKPAPVSDLIQAFQLQEFLQLRANKLSGGQKRRLALAAAFVGNPDVVFLDEPTTGLDAHARQLLWDVIRKYEQMGKTIFLTTHYLEEIEKVASRIIFLHDGEVKVDGTVADVKKLAAQALAYVHFHCAVDGNFRKLEHVHEFHQDGTAVRLATYNVDDLIRELVAKKIPFENLTIQRENLESAFLSLSKKKEA